MPRPAYRRRWAWVGGMVTPPQETIPDVQSASFTLSRLADQGLLTTRHLADFQDETGLADFGWRVTWNMSALADANGDLRSLLRRTQGFVIFMHGWCSDASTWEHLPALTCAANPRLVVLTPDLNGFGRSRFLAEVPSVEYCDPRAVMRVVAYWVEMLQLRSSARARQRRNVITFVGHSTGGAALFTFQPDGWHKDEYARCAVAPTLLIDQTMRHSFYQKLGVAAWADQPLELKSRLTPQILDRLLGSVGGETLSEHRRVFEVTPRGTLAQTLYATGRMQPDLEAQRWRNVRVILGHEDPLLQVSRMLRLLDDLGLAANQVQVVRGEHFLFATAGENQRIQRRNREIVLGEVLYLHEVCRENQRS